MGVTILIGSQWGDEGKGKVVDLLSQSVDIVARYQGGANAGHTIVIDGKQHVLHLIPSGIFTPGVKCVIGNGTVVDPESLLAEIDMLQKVGIDLEGRLFVSHRAHLIMPYHKLLDAASEKRRNNSGKSIGTTGRGIGPAYIDKYNRRGIRIVDLLDRDVFEEKLRANLAVHNDTLQKIYGLDALRAEDIMEQYLNYDELIDPYVTETSALLNEALREGKRVLAEGAQGVLLDVDHGTYPYVTSSSPTSGGACSGLGIPPTAVDSIWGVVKAYATRVGNGPFPTELTDATGELLQRAGNEFGTTTGRSRRCGWLDLVALRYSVQLNGIDSLALTKLDVLNSLPEIRLCTSYVRDGKPLKHFPAEVSYLNNPQCEYETFAGWQQSLAGIERFEDLPPATIKYIQRIEEFCGVPVRLISVGPDRRQTLTRF